MAMPNFPYQIIRKKGKWVERVIGNCSDGDQRHWPTADYRPASAEKYLIKLGEDWMKRDGLDEPGAQYYIDRLPHGYALFETSSGDGTQYYKRLFGHPTKKYYDSIPTFLPHFLWLQSDMAGDCECKVCGGKRSMATTVIKPRKPRNALDATNILPTRLTLEATGQESDSSARDSSVGGIGTGRARRDVKQSGRPYARDEEGTEDVYKLFVKRLEAARGGTRSIEEDITEINSIDWRAEHHHAEYGKEDLLPTHLTRIEQQHAFVPRIGEMVLFCPNFQNGYFLMLDKTTGEHKYYSFRTKRFHGRPEWRAGVVTQVPSASAQNGPIDFTDLLDTPDKQTALNTAGFRVETMPDPNDPLGKYVSKQYKYVPMRSIRPLSHWHAVLRGVPEPELHPSIKHAFTCMTTVTLVEKFKAVGKWPAASIFCRGIYLGSEFITVGDVVRLVSRQSPSNKCTDVMVVESIRLNLEGMQQEHVSPGSPYLASKTSITLTGVAYTTDMTRCDQTQQHMATATGMQQISPLPLIPKDTIKVLFRPVGSTEYGSWYRLFPQHKKLEVSYDQVLGRLYEAEAVRLWTGQRQEKVRKGAVLEPASLDFDVTGILAARNYATCADERLPAPSSDGSLWFWADTRVQALDLATINGLEVGTYHDIRDRDTLAGWREIMHILNGTSTLPTDIDNFTSIFPASGRGRKPGSKLVKGKLVYPGDPEYPGGSSNVGDAAGDVKPKASSQMAGAALASTDEEGSEGDDLLIEKDAPDTLQTRDGSENMLSKFQGKPPPQPARKSLTKEQIIVGAIQSIESEEEIELDYSDDNRWLTEPLVVRGGTEESSGGDYAPQKQNKKTRKRRPSHNVDDSDDDA